MDRLVDDVIAEIKTNPHKYPGHARRMINSLDQLRAELSTLRQRNEELQKVVDVTLRLNDEIKLFQPDMGGNHKYTLNIKAHPLITELREALRSLEGK